MNLLRKPFFIIILLTLAMTIPGNFVLAASWSNATSQTSELIGENIGNPGSVSRLPSDVDTLSFKDFGFQELTLQGPFAANGYYFDLPSTWKMKPGGELRLTMDVFFTDATAESKRLDNIAYGGTLLIQYNYITVAAIDLNNAQQQLVIPIAYDTLTRLGSNQSQSIQFILDSGVNCDANFRTTVVVRTSSEVFLPHDQLAPILDLKMLPVPFFENSFFQDTAIIIVPDQPSEEELQAALAVSAGFGRLTFTRMLLSLLPVSKVSPDQLANNNLIFVGSAKDLPLLEKVTLPAPVSNGKFNVKESSSKDGIVQIGISPWNSAKVVLSIGGNDDATVVTAGQAVSTGTIQTGNNPSLALVSSVQPVIVEPDPSVTNKTLKDLGYDNIVVNQVGINTVEYKFDVPQDYTIGTDASLNLSFSHSSLLEYQRSSISVKLNGEPISSVRLSDSTSGQGTAKISFPASAIYQGSNSLRLDILMEPSNVCVNPLLEGIWARIDSASNLHLPFVPDPANLSTLLDLKRYPSQTTNNRLMTDLGFVLAKDDPSSWNVAVQIANSLGNTNSIQIAAMNAYYSDAIPDSAKQNQNLIVIGRPSKLPFLAELQDVLPASFEAGSDVANQDNFQVAYTYNPGDDIGYLELLSAPWNTKRSILYIGGTSELGVKWAGNALQFGRLKSQLNGNLAFINNEQIISVDTRSIQQGVQDVLAPSPDSLVKQPEYQRPAWILPTIQYALGGLVLVLIILGVQTLLRARKKK